MLSARGKMIVKQVYSVVIIKSFSFENAFVRMAVDPEEDEALDIEGCQGPARIAPKAFYLRAFDTEPGCDCLMLYYQTITAKLSYKIF